MGQVPHQNNSDFLVAGRRLGPFLYTGAMAAVVLGGASTVGGGLGYKFGISGMWLVVAIGAGVLLLSLLFAGTIQKLKIYTVSQMLTAIAVGGATDGIYCILYGVAGALIGMGASVPWQPWKLPSRTTFTPRWPRSCCPSASAD